MFENFGCNVQYVNQNETVLKKRKENTLRTVEICMGTRVGLRLRITYFL